MYKNHYRMPQETFEVCAKGIIGYLLEETKARKHTDQIGLGKNKYGEIEGESYKKGWSCANRFPVHKLFVGKGLSIPRTWVCTGV